MDYIFWTCWSVEMLAVLFWLANIMRLKYVAPNALSFCCAIYLFAVLAVRLTVHAHQLSTTLVVVPIAALLLLLLLNSMHTLSRGVWN